VQPAVDWDLAARLAARAVRPGPPASRAQREEVVAALRSAAPVAAEHVSRLTRLGPPPADLAVRVVDRPSWARANVRSLRALTAGAAVTDRAGLRGAAGAGQVAAVLGLLSGSVLGQYDPWAGRGALLLVAPNVLAVERRLGVAPADFRLWVALHEQTHAQQFAAAPWLTGHLAGRVAALLAPGPDDAGAGGGAWSLAGSLDEAQRAALDEVGAVMALLEGHADVTMDAVGRSVVPSVRRIRRRFEARRDAGRGTGALHRVVRSLLGTDVKLAQYRDGAAFVRAVRRRVGTSGLNAAFAAPEALPTAAEIAEPAAWLRRVHG
jgi:coenzyme F420 biosynthesis associated uncharacterized protein